MSGKALISSGYQDLVLIAPKDKRPVRQGWLHSFPSADEVAAWTGNLGLAAAEFPAIDVDLHDPAMAIEVAKMAAKHLGAAPVRRSHREASLLLPYRTNEPFKKMAITLPDNLGMVEVLGDGQQYLVHGIHPKGTPYSWENRALWDVPATGLSLVTKDKVEAFLAAVVERYGGVRSIGARGRPEHVDNDDLLAPSLDHLQSALDAIPNNDAFLGSAFRGAEGRDAWMTVAHAVYGAGGPQAEQMFVDWTSTYADGDSNPDKARAAFRSCADTYTGWDTIDRLAMLAGPDAEDEFEPDLGELEVQPFEFPDSVRLTDEYVVDRLLPFLEDEICFVGKKTWMYWAENHWAYDEGLEHEAKVRAHLRVFALDLDDKSHMAPSKEEAKALRGLAKRLQSKAGIEAIVGMSRVRVRRRMEDFDKDIYALNTPAGLVNLTTGESRPTTPKDWVSRVTEVAPAPVYIPGRAPNWENFLDDLCKGDAELADFLQRYMGYCLTGDMSEKKLAFVWGSNSNTGKSTFVNAVMYAIGSYAKGVDVDAFMGQRGNTDSLAQLPGVRLASATEASAGQKWDDKIIKGITGGDRIEARRLHQSFFTFQPQFKLLIAGNHRPSLASVDVAMLKRVLIVPMNNAVEEENIDRLLGQKLQAEAPQILRWMIEGALSWLKRGLDAPEAVLVATEEYVEEEDILAAWIDECCDLDPEHWVSTADLFSNWSQWNRGRGAGKGGTQISFGRMLSAEAEKKDRSFEKKRTNVANGWSGIQLKPRVALGTTEFDT